MSRDLCSHPAYKLLTIRHVPQVPESCVAFSNESYNGLIRRLHGMFSRLSIIDLDGSNPHIDRSVGNVSEPCEAAAVEYYPRPVEEVFQRPSFVPIYIGSLHASASPLFLPLSKSPSTNMASVLRCVTLQQFAKTRVPGNGPGKIDAGLNLDSTTRVAGHTNIAVGCWLSVRGKSVKDAVVDVFQNNVRYWKHSIDPLKIFLDTDPLLVFDKSASLVSNCQTPVIALQSVLERAEKMASARAYIHQYERYGIGFSEIRDAIRRLHTIIYSYQNLGRNQYG